MVRREDGRVYGEGEDIGSVDIVSRRCAKH
jgi:hypothetical protein